MTKQQSQELIATTKNLAIAAESLDAGLTAALALNSDRITRLEAAAEEQSSRLNTVIDRIIAMVDDETEDTPTDNPKTTSLAAEGTAECVKSQITNHKSQNELLQRITDLETENTSLRTQLAAQADPQSPIADHQSRNDSGSQSEITNRQSQIRKTLPALVTNLLAKSNIDINAGMDPHALDSALSQLSIDQRIAVKMQMARAGLIA